MNLRDEFRVERSEEFKELKELSDAMAAIVHVLNGSTGNLYEVIPHLKDALKHDYTFKSIAERLKKVLGDRGNLYSEVHFANNMVPRINEHIREMERIIIIAGTRDFEKEGIPKLNKLANQIKNDMEILVKLLRWYYGR